MPGSLIVDRPAEGVLRLAISNPAKRNALDHAVLGAISGELATLADDVRCVMLTGAHEMFSSGYDISDIPLADFPAQAEKLVDRGLVPALTALARSATCPVEVVAPELPRSSLQVEATAFFCCSRVVVDATGAVRLLVRRDGPDLRLSVRCAVLTTPELLSS